jgi:homoserine O-acetyltransferase/O-succinyltransferase
MPVREAVMKGFCGAFAIALSLVAGAAAADSPKSGDWVARDFHFHTGETMPALKLHYTTLGDPSGQPVLVLHGTGGSGGDMLNPGFGGELFGPGQPLDSRKYFIILPDAIGSGASSKPSDGLRMKFPRYNYDDIVAAQYRLLTEHLGIHHLRLVIGNSMGGMMAWQWGVQYPGFMDGLVPLASQPSAMASRSWALRRIAIETIKRDPAWKGGDYTTQPPGAKIAHVFFGIATSGGTQGWAKRAPTRAAADRIVETQLDAPDDSDANDTIYALDSSRDYDPAPKLEQINAAVLAINSADDERNPAETGITERNLKRVKNARLYLIPASEETRGHGTTGMAKLWKDQFTAWLAALPK